MHQADNDRPPKAIYNLNGEYKTFSGSIVAAPTTNSNQAYKVAIYVDDQLLFSKTGITKTTGKVNFNIDVSNGQKLEIRMGCDNGDSNEQLALVNAALKK